MSDRKWKWLWAGALLLILVCLGCILGMYNIEQDETKKVPTWLQIASQALCAFSGIYVAFVIFLQSKAETDRVNREMIERHEAAAKQQVLAIERGANNKVEAIHVMRTELVRALHELAKKTESIKTKNEAIDCIGLRRDKRDLEEKITGIKKIIQRKKNEFESIKGWKFLRTPAERESELNAKKTEINESVKKIRGFMDDLEHVKIKLLECSG